MNINQGGGGIRDRGFIDERNVNQNIAGPARNNLGSFIDKITKSNDPDKIDNININRSRIKQIITDSDQKIKLLSSKLLGTIRNREEIKNLKEEIAQLRSYDDQLLKSKIEHETLKELNAFSLRSELDAVNNEFLKEINSKSKSLETTLPKLKELLGRTREISKQLEEKIPTLKDSDDRKTLLKSQLLKSYELETELTHFTIDFQHSNLVDIVEYDVDDLKKPRKKAEG